MKNLTEGNIYKNFLFFAVPIIISGLLSQLYNAVDSMIAGKYLGEAGLASVGATSAFITFATSIFWGYNTGSSIYTAILFGGGKFKTLKKAVYSSIAMVLGISFTISFFSLLFKDQIFDLLKIAPDIRSSASVYYVIYISGLFTFSLNHFGVCTMQSLGISEYPLRMSIISMFINIGGNLLSVAVFHFGVAGLAISSILAAVIPCICYAIRLKKCFAELNVSDYKIKISGSLIKKTFSFAIPVMVQQSIMYMSSLIVSPIVNALGSSATAAYSVDLQIYDLNAGVYQNSSKSLMNYTAQCVGAGKTDSLKKGVRAGFLQGFIMLVPFLAISACFSSRFCAMFFPAGYSGDALALSVRFVRYFLPFVMINVINNLFHAFFRGIKAMNYLLIFTTIGAVSRVIATLLLSRTYQMNGVYLGWVISWICEALPVTLLYISGIWKKQLKKNV